MSDLVNEETALSNLVELLSERAQRHPERKAFIFLHNGETETGYLTYAALHQRAMEIATSLTQQLALEDSGTDTRSGSVPKRFANRLTLVYPYEAALEFIAAFLGCLYAGVVPVPCHPPRNQQGVAEVGGRLLGSGSAGVLTVRSLLPKLQRQLAPELPTGNALRWLAHEECRAAAD
ncbi:MAG: hypothetical protein D6742_09565, partial [Cyanobacteria bacterium J069]